MADKADEKAAKENRLRVFRPNGAQSLKFCRDSARQVLCPAIA